MSMGNLFGGSGPVDTLDVDTQLQSNGKGKHCKVLRMSKIEADIDSNVVSQM